MTTPAEKLERLRASGWTLERIRRIALSRGDKELKSLVEETMENENAEKQEEKSEVEKLPNTRSLARLEQLAIDFGEDTTRGKAIRSVMSFRSSWLRCGRMLNEIAYGGDYKEWGFDDFECYCARELGLKKASVQKMMVSYNYMKSHETKRLVDGADAVYAPSIEAVNELANAERKELVDADTLKEIHAKVMDGDMGAKETKQAIREACGTAPIPGMKDDAAYKKFVADARKLRRDSEGLKKLPEGLRERIEILVVEVEELDV